MLVSRKRREMSLA